MHARCSAWSPAVLLSVDFMRLRADVTLAEQSMANSCQMWPSYEQYLGHDAQAELLCVDNAGRGFGHLLQRALHKWQDVGLVVDRLVAQACCHISGCQRGLHQAGTRVTSLPQWTLNNVDASGQAMFCKACTHVHPASIVVAVVPLKFDTSS